MNFIVSSSTLTSHLQAISRVINSKNTIPVLDCFLFEIEGNILRLTASDMRTAVGEFSQPPATGGRFALLYRLLPQPVISAPCRSG